MSTILVVNSGSSSIKVALYPATGGDARPLLRGSVENIGQAGRLTLRDASGNVVAETAAGEAGTHEAALKTLLDQVEARTERAEIVAAGHRVVHGGRAFTHPTLIDDDVLARLAALGPLAPQHQPHNLAAIRALSRIHPNIPQVACFDTSFHASQPAVASSFALPRALSREGIRRYGFHGLSYDYIAGVLPEHIGGRAEGRVVVAHLGHGASMCAMLHRRSVATTMGFSALDGLMMGTRCGALDPGVILHLLQERGMSAAEISRLLYEQSGLLGVSGETDDMRALLASSSVAAAEAIELFVYRIVRELGSLAAALGGLDALVFTGGIGENSPEIRARVGLQTGWLGIALDAERNRAGGPLIGGGAGTIPVLALRTDEESVIAAACRALLGG